MGNLFNCHSCGKEISKHAKQCPHCGHSYELQSKPQKQNNQKTGILNQNIGCGGLIVIIFIGWLIFKESPSEKSTRLAEERAKKEAIEASKTPQQIRKETIEKAFSAWDGSHYNLERYIKKHLKDPDRYEHIETRFGDKVDHILVITKYRARNSFGGMVIEQVAAKTDINGNITEILAAD